ncbi:MAG: glycoside hydrolase/phage tail family protein [Mesorhizobium sp.]|nr:glycoside hydrolase/phage tail family protein [Mesorhizobium sp.]MBL8579013.1 glycoside hydrolase/phage tail family protein [Mesorhizobium sp.]
MATILLQVAGAAIGSLFGPVGTAIGAAAGAMAGYSIDQALINGTRRIDGPKLSGARPFTAEEGAAIPRIYGTARVGGTMIWATHFEERSSTSRQGKNGPKITEYSYFASVAFALCEGEIAGIRRVWADGREVDRNTLELRVHSGGEAQSIDPLIGAKQGADNAPAYRGTAYVVIERMGLADYGNRIPQFQFEVLRPVGELPKMIRAVSLIPGATEYGLSPSLVTRQHRRGETEAVNRHVLHAASDIEASLDELQMLCPNLEHVALVLAWFGNDLRAGHCRIRPAVTTSNGSGFSQAWQVSGATRFGAMVVSTHDGGAAYGGTPSDQSVIAAIAEIKSRGLKVTLYPFVMMDIPADNELPDPHGNDSQPAYPWRGRITCDPAPLMPATVDRTATAREQIEELCGSALPGQFLNFGGAIYFSGSPGDWGYRRFILHHAKLAQAAGGVDAFLLGSEMRGLTTLRDEDDAFPFVEALCTLAGEARTMLGSSTKITYGADWSEYFGYHPQDGSGDVWFHLDPLWAHDAINAIGIDNYMPLSDWRDADYSGGNPDGFSGPYDPVGLRESISGGEGFDWYYPSFADRRARERVTITDGAYGKPWVYRYKDLKSWWSQPHYNRVGGVEADQATDWVPQGKPFMFTEVGGPASDKGPNQPNVFSDPKSAEGGLPHFSDGGRSDLAQQRLLAAHHRHWNPDGDDFEETDNPISAVDGRRMVDPERLYVWAWDARPYPAFPLQSGVWADHGNWHYGHWLNGRLGNPTVGETINAILRDHGLPLADMTSADGTLHGYVIDESGSARGALEPLVDLFGLSVQETASGLVFEGRAGRVSIEIGEMVSDGRDTVIERVRSPDNQLPSKAVLSFREPLLDYQVVSVSNAWHGAPVGSQHATGFAGIIEAGQGRALAADWLRRAWSERERVIFAIAQPNADILPGALMRLPGLDTNYLVTEIEDGLVRRVVARQVVQTAPTAWLSANPGAAVELPMIVGQPLAVFADLPLGIGTGGAEEHFRVAAWQRPWKSQVVLASPEDSGFVQRATLARPADIGTLVEALAPGVVGRLDHSIAVSVELNSGAFSSVSSALLLNGANTIAVRAANGVWEIVQFETADEIAADTWRLSGLLRGQLGTDDATAAGAEIGTHLLVLDDKVQAAGLLPGEAGLSLKWRVGPAGADLSDSSFSAHSEIGGRRALLPLAPVHLRARSDDEGVTLSWIRRGRIDADNWIASDIPLGEEHEEYQVEIAHAGGAIVRSATAATPSFLYGSAEIAADFGTPPIEIDVTVRQLSLSAGLGLPATRRLSLS